jgi:hypothetical protein
MYVDDLKTNRPRKSVLLAIATPTQFFAQKIYFGMGLAGADPFATALTLAAPAGDWLIRRGDVVDVLGLITIFIELTKAARIDTVGQINFVLSVLVTISMVVMMVIVPATFHYFTIKLVLTSLACVVATALLRVSVARRDLNLGN